MASMTLQKYITQLIYLPESLQCRHNERNGVSNHQRIHCLLNCWFRRKSKKTSKLCVTGLCVGNSPVTGEFPAQKANNAEHASIWWPHHDVESLIWATLRAGSLGNHHCHANANLVKENTNTWQMQSWVYVIWRVYIKHIRLVTSLISCIIYFQKCPPLFWCTIHQKYMP